MLFCRLFSFLGSFIYNIIACYHVIQASFIYNIIACYHVIQAFPSGSAVKNPVAMQETQETRVQCGLGRSPGRGHGNPPQYSCLENPMGWGAWRATVHGVTKVKHDWSYWACTHALAFNFHFIMTTAYVTLWLYYTVLKVCFAREYLVSNFLYN